MIEKLQSVDIDTIISELKILPKYKTTICLQGTKEISDPMIDVIGQDVDYRTKNEQDPAYLKQPGLKGYVKEKYGIIYNSDDFIYPLFDMPYINSLMEKFKMKHSRILTMKPKTCYSYHYDDKKIIHIPVISDKDCWFIINKELFDASVGNCYIVDTTQMHTYVNASLRTHRVVIRADI